MFLLWIGNSYTWEGSGLATTLEANKVGPTECPDGTAADMGVLASLHFVFVCY